MLGTLSKRSRCGIIGLIAGIILLLLFFGIAWFIITHLVQIAISFMIMLLPIFMIVVMAILAKKFLFGGGK